MRNARHRAIGFRLNALHRTLERSFHFIQHLNAIRIHDVTDQFHPTHIQFNRCHLLSPPWFLGTNVMINDDLPFEGRRYSFLLSDLRESGLSENSL